MTSDAQDERPAALRLAQTNFKFCDNLTLYGECRYGDNCFFAHSSSEADIFKRWKRAQKANSAALVPRPLGHSFRTRLCHNWLHGTCRFGAACNFAHGEEALRPLSDTGRLTNSSLVSSSPVKPAQLGNSTFAAKDETTSASLLPATSLPKEAPANKYKTRLCIYFMQQGRCRNGADCTFAHGQDDIARHSMDNLLLPVAPRPDQEKDSRLQGEVSALKTSAPEATMVAPLPISQACAPPTISQACLQQHSLAIPSRQDISCSSSDLDNSKHKQGNPYQQLPAKVLGLPETEFPPLGDKRASASGQADRAEGGFSEDATSSNSSEQTGKSLTNRSCISFCGEGHCFQSDQVSLAAQPSSASSSLCDVVERLDAQSCLSSITAASSMHHPLSTNREPAGMVLVPHRCASTSIELDRSHHLSASGSHQQAQRSISIPRNHSFPDKAHLEGCTDEDVKHTASSASLPDAVCFLAPSSPRLRSPVQVFFKDSSSAGTSSSGSSLLHSREGSTCGADLALQFMEAPLPTSALSGAMKGARHPVCHPLSPPPPRSPSNIKLCSRSLVDGRDQALLLGGYVEPPLHAPFPPHAPIPQSKGGANAMPCPGESEHGPPHAFSLTCEVGGMHSFRCPLSQVLFANPVVAADGFTYEKAAIHDWLYRKGKDFSPVTGQPLPHNILVPNMNMRMVMAEVSHVLYCIRSWAGLGIVAEHHIPYPPPQPPPRSMTTMNK